MNTPNDELLTRLRTTFERGMDSVGDVDIADDVSRKARRIRRSRRLAAAAVAAAVLVAAPVSVASIRDVADRDPSNGPATQPTQTPTDPEARVVNVDLANLPAGDSPSVPYLVGVTWHSGDTSVDLDEGYSPFLTLPFGEHVFSDYVAGEGVDAYAIDDQPRHELGDDDGEHHSPVGGPDDTVWWIEPDRTEANPVHAAWKLARLSVDDNGTEQIRRFPIPGVWGGEGSGGPPVLHGFVGDDLVVTVTDTGEEQSHLVWFRGGDPTRRAELGPYESARLADPDSGIVFGVTGWSQSHICGDLFDARQLTPRWSSCDWSPVAISPDGSKVFALPSSRPPVNPSVAVLDADTGEVLMQLTMDGRRVDGYTTGVFEDEDTIDVSATQNHDHAVIRCSVSALACETAVPPSRERTHLSNPAYE